MENRMFFIVLIFIGVSIALFSAGRPARLPPPAWESDFLLTPEEAGTVWLLNYRGSCLDIQLPSHTLCGRPVSVISMRALANKHLTSVTIPYTIRWIDKHAFANNNLTSIVIPDSVAEIGEGAFARNPLSSVIVPPSVTIIRRGAFADTFLTDVTIPNTVVRIHDGAFGEARVFRADGTLSVGTEKGVRWSRYGDTVIITGFSRMETGVQIPSQIQGLPVTEIESHAFKGLQLISVAMPDSITQIWDEAFAKNDLSSVSIPQSVTRIRPRAFADNQLSSVIIPNNVWVDRGAFAENPLTCISIGSGVNIIRHMIPLGNDRFSTSFADFYEKHGRRAGTYTYHAGIWSVVFCN